MAFKISGFGSYEVDKIEARPIQQEEQQITVPRKSVVQVRLPFEILLRPSVLHFLFLVV